MPDEPPLARRDVIASRLAHGHSVVAAALAHEFAVSEDAIRRDLRALADEGLCRRVYGGALPISPASVSMATRTGMARDRKLSLARAAASAIQPGEFLFLDSGSTNLALAEVLPEDHELTVATNSVDIAATVLRRQDLKLILIGGPVDALIGGCVDGAAVQSVSQLNIDRCFIGACALGAGAGLSDFHSSDATFKRALLGVSTHCCALVTTDKFAKRAPYRVAPLTAIHTLVVEHDAPRHLLEPLIQAGVTLLQAEPA
ncbi:MAG: DeoR/GlpR transcriptional regulator [Proteobacteria bacterium]|nr:DeoR/GlpR transcriptional regulator [Pseudomonadota bacterium]